MLMLVDAPGLWYRAFYGLPSSMRSPDGVQINAVRGFCDGLAVLLRKHRPDKLVCAVDFDWRPAWRVELLPSYKAHRVADDGAEAEPDELGPQVEIIGEMLDALGIAVVGASGNEADDVLATLAARAGEPVVVASGDRDLFQLVDDAARIQVVYFGRGVANAETYDEAAVRKRFGVEASQYVDYAVLRGDPSDGLSGVKGIGDKTAAALMGAHGCLRGLVDAAADPDSALKPRVRAAVTEHAEYLAAASRVVRTVSDAPVAHVDAALRAAPADADALGKLAERYGLANPIERLGKAIADALEGSE
ncbi:MAG: 5'-3' exonuclease [Stackebrandtia sp.]